MKKSVKKVISVLMAIVTIFSVSAMTLTASAATVTPSFGSAPSKVTLYVNDSNNDSRTINIKIANWVSGYTYKAYSANESVAKIQNASVNSKSGVLFTIQAKNLGSTKITVQMCKSSKVIQTKTISVTVSRRTQKAPTSLKVISTTGSSVKISYSQSNKNYINGYWIQVSTHPRFSSNVKTYKVTSKNTTSVTLSGLKSNTVYFVRIASMSTLNNCYLLSSYSSAVSFTTKR